MIHPQAEMALPGPLQLLSPAFHLQHFRFILNIELRGCRDNQAWSRSFFKIAAGAVKGDWKVLASFLK
jgi:hypothetical protein